MDGILMSLLHGNLSQLSDESLRVLVKYYETGILSLQDQSLLLDDLTKPKAMSPMLLSLD
jgi:hypothetical protein